MEFDKIKFKHLVHYVIWKVGKDDWFGSTKLNKVLWFVDARAYVLTGKPITGEAYTRGEFGPVPQHILPIRRELEREGAIKVTQEGELTRLTAARAAQPSWFSETELQSIDWWATHISRNHTAASISEETHDYSRSDFSRCGSSLHGPGLRRNNHLSNSATWRYSPQSTAPRRV